jgi:hypothetical protein
MLAVGTVGCAHVQLRWNTTHQARTMTEIYEQQVLDNMAMFVHDENSLPFFSIPQSGTNQVVDTANAGTDLKWNNTSFMEGLLKLSGMRSMTEAWNLAPVSDPRRLELMRCAYQQAVAGCTGAETCDSCPDCEKLRKKFHIGVAETSETLADFTRETGKTSPACLQAVCWFGCGCEKCVPKKCPCLKVGHYCGTYVWVLPGGQNELSKLTLLVLDYAINQPATISPGKTLDIEYRLNKEGVPIGDGENAAIIVKGTFDATKPLPRMKGGQLTDAAGGQTDGGLTLKALGESVATPAPSERFQAPYVDPIFPLEQRLRPLMPQPTIP